MESWSDLYLEMAEILSADLNEKEQEKYGSLNTLHGYENKTPVRWIDLWKNQVSFLSEELEFPTPAVFLSFRTKQVDDLAEKVQQITLQVDSFLFYESFSESFQGSFNQDDAMHFLKILNFINGRFHGSSGSNYNSMRKVGFNQEDTGGAGSLYKIVFECIIRDESAAQKADDGAFTGIEFEINYQTTVQ
ncbi:hypothetical protein [Chryseobacterium mulctrae]|uniref:hypothetical protein n=1 Tax=Chryseobacterium mulctrae TaxID=2576777 RepID=UPI001116DF7C|nr:hypothetical protein [Chryseobacterium mulctrae]